LFVFSNIINYLWCFFLADTLVNLGCWRDNLVNRAIPFTIFTKYDKAVVLRVCTDISRSKGYNVFGVQDEGYCMVGDNAESRYKMYGNTTACKNGLGASLINSVYRLPG